ncbi:MULTISPECIES: LysR family transcriptional regulator [Xenorhabdus]|uniref:DNA-binding transcriptional LysR family regulator n=1 Tax=Xenorhabdus ehlersii TaxID=290111 RepID=A0A2D0IZ82_9GAMM|nr:MULTISPECIES: LysR family transcriptional regulator [Xenorhabdus]MBC8947497.1 LysR family transcriptional regulator [Xenorhabdus sp. TS4]PHM27258.1 LysR family transcriptional regulator [Xenorhabdus ehlersii]RKE87428.1 DNA-binding transcriptional LysR family regulator [Xenorhabdus ehlersii]
MDIRNLEAFIVLAETLNYHKASERLYLSQPALTKKIHGLEDILGASLFTRGPNGTRLTDFGQKTLENTRKFLSHYEHFKSQVHFDSKEDMVRHLYVGSCFPIHNYSQIENQIVEKKGNVVLSLVTGLSVEQQINLLNAGMLHVAVMPLSSIIAQLEPKKVFTERLIYIFKKGSYLVSKCRTALSKFGNGVTPTNSPEKKEMVELTECLNVFPIYTGAGDNMHLLLKTNDIMLIVEMITKNNAYTCVPKRIISSIPEYYMNFLEIVETDKKIDLGVVWAKSIDESLIEDAENFSALVANV